MMIIDGPARLSGELSVQGAKNSTLPLLAGALLCKGQTCCTTARTFRTWTRP